MANRKRTGRGGISFTYTPEEERKLKEKRIFKEILPLMASVLLEMHQDVSEDSDEEPKLKSSRGSSSRSAVSKEKILRLRKLIEATSK